MTTKHDHLTILAIDPGLRDLGFALLHGSELRTHGVLALRELEPKIRLRRVREALERWIKAYDPDVLVLEHIPKRPLDSLAGLPALGRLLQRVAKRSRLDVVSYSAKSVRRSVVGNGWAGKAEVAKVLMARFRELKVYRGALRKWQDRHWQNMFDALALAVYHQSLIQPPSRSR